MMVNVTNHQKNRLETTNLTFSIYNFNLNFEFYRFNFQDIKIIFIIFFGFKLLLLNEEIVKLFIVFLILYLCF